MTNGFALHGIAHLSPSSLNLWASEPALWTMEKLLKRRGPVGCAAHRGTAVEAGVVMGLQDMQADVAACQAHALSEFDRLSALSGDPRRQKEREAVAPTVAVALTELRQYGQPDGYQGRVEHWFDGLPVPIIGFYDLRWSQHGIVVDLKTQLRLASEISAGHARQVALYVHDTNDQGRLAYTTPQKIGVYVLDNPAEHVAALVNMARRLGRFLSVSKDPGELAGLLCPNYDAFYWNDATSRAIGREVYGF